MKRLERRLFFIFVAVTTFLLPLSTVLADDGDMTAIVLKDPASASANPIEWVLYAQGIALVLLIALTVNASRIFRDRFRKTND